MLTLDKTTEASAAPEKATDAGTLLRDAAKRLPEDALILLAVRHMGMFPGMILPISMRRERSLAAAQAALKAERPFGLLLQKNPEANEPGPDDLYSIGTVATTLRYITSPDGTHHVVAQGEQRFRVIEFLEGYPFLAARVERITEQDAKGTDVEASFLQLKERAKQIQRLVLQIVFVF